MQIQLLLFLAAWFLELSHALSVPRIKTRCWPKPPQAPQLQSSSCTTALREILHRYPRPSYTFSKTAYPSPGTVELPLLQSYQDCTLMVDLFYVVTAREAMSQIVAAADRVIEDCVETRQYAGGSRAIGNTGLWLDIVPTKTMRSGRITMDYSNDTATS